MQIAITNHAVERYQQRVPSAAKLTADAIRTLMRNEVEEAFRKQRVRDHPGFPDRRMVQFQVGQEKLFLALGPNETDYPGDWAVIGVLYDREVGKNGMNTTLGDVVPEALKQKLAETVQSSKPRFLVRIRGSKEIYDVKDEAGLAELLERRQPTPSDVEIFERREYSVKTKYVIEK